jgi:NAD/NADP transhydrogenase beta subunit
MKSGQAGYSRILLWHIVHAIRRWSPAMPILSHLLDPAVAPRRVVTAKDDRSSLACVCGVSAAGLALGLVTALGPSGADMAVATALVAAFAGAGAVGLGIGLAAVLWR